MRVLQVSDLHYSGKHLAEADRCFSFAVDQAITAGVDAAVIAGDATDHALELHSPAAAALARNVRRLADHCPVLMLQGTFSHEPPGGVGLFRLLGGRHGVHVAERIEQVALLTDGSWCARRGGTSKRCRLARRPFSPASPPSTRRWSRRRWGRRGRRKRSASS